MIITRATVYINKNNLIANYNKIKDSFKQNIILVVKANAYGHGIKNICLALQKEKVFAYAVATIEEAILIRKLLIFTPILLLGDTSDYESLSRQQIAIISVSISQIKKLIQSKRIITIHIMIDCGMYREGLTKDEVQEVITLCKNTNVHIKGFCTHFSDISLVDSQRDLFQETILPYKEKEGILIHTNAPSGIEKVSSPINGIRIGLRLYGLEEKFDQVLTLMAPIIRIRKIDGKTSVGYGVDHQTLDEGYVYTIGLGYGDGWLRMYKTEGYINGEYLQQIGLTCMDYLMLFSKEKYDSNDEIEILGPHISIVDFAKDHNMIPYEVTTLLNSRLTKKIK